MGLHCGSRTPTNNMINAVSMLPSPNLQMFKSFLRAESAGHSQSMNSIAPRRSLHTFAQPSQYWSRTYARAKSKILFPCHCFGFEYQSSSLKQCWLLRPQTKSRRNHNWNNHYFNTKEDKSACCSVVRMVNRSEMCSTSPILDPSKEDICAPGGYWQNPDRSSTPISFHSPSILHEAKTVAMTCTRIFIYMDMTLVLRTGRHVNCSVCAQKICIRFDLQLGHLKYRVQKRNITGSHGILNNTSTACVMD